MKKVLFSLFVLAGFAACTSDDVVISESTGTTSDTATAYLTVRISDATSNTRAISEGYQDAVDDSENGGVNEYGVANAYFYFYDANGEFVSRGEVEPTFTETSAENANIQFTSPAVVVLKGITQIGYPRYMVTVLNRTSTLETNATFYEPAGTLAEFEKTLAEPGSDSRDGQYNSDWGADETGFNINAGIWDANGNFVMSTTSFLNDGDGDIRAGQYESGYYFVTELQNTDFYEEPVGNENAKPVDVYVERLAAKVTMTVGNDIVDAEGQPIYTQTWEDEDGNEVTGYLYKGTIAGAGNVYDEGIDEDNGEEEGVEDIYIVLEGWKLNATARESYIVKNIDTAWDVDDIGWTDQYGETVAWQAAADNRSFWGESFNYGIGGYATSSDNGLGQYTGDQAGNYDADEYNSATWLNDYVKYTSLYTPNEFGDAEYCAENTNTAEVLQKRTSSGITSALVKARAYASTTVAGETTYSPITLIRYKGELFTEDAFIAKVEEDVVDAVDAAVTTINYSVRNIYEGSVDQGLGIPDQIFTSAMTAEELDEICGDGYAASLTALFSEDNLSWTTTGSGAIQVHAIIDTDDDENQQWTFIKGENDEGVATYTFVENMDGSSEILAAISSAVEEFNTDANTIYAYNDGWMYYNVPIEHLNDSVVNGANGSQTDGNFAEGQYGVVRNHAYTLTIQGISELGQPIADEQEVIIPDEEEPVYLYVEAQINILAWKDVRQGVTLK